MRIDRLAPFVRERDATAAGTTPAYPGRAMIHSETTAAGADLPCAGIGSS